MAKLKESHSANSRWHAITGSSSVSVAIKLRPLVPVAFKLLAKVRMSDADNGLRLFIHVFMAKICNTMVGYDIVSV